MKPPTRYIPAQSIRTYRAVCNIADNIIQEAFEKCWAHSPQRAAHSADVASGTVARRLRIDVHDDIDNDNDDDDNDNA